MKLRWVFLLTTGLLLAGSAFAQAPARTGTQNASPQNSSAKAAPLAPDAAAKLQKRAEDFLRDLYAWGSEFEVKADELKPSPIADLYEINVKVGLQGQSDSALVYVTKDGRYIFRGEISDMNADPFGDIRSKLNLEGTPSKGPADAKYVMVEFGDFQCPSCRQLEYILRDIVANNPQVRLVFKISRWSQSTPGL